MASARVSTASVPRARTRRNRSRGHLAATCVAVVCALAGGAYLIARETSLFALQSVAVEGAPVDLQRSVVAALSRFDGQSLVVVSPEDVDAVVEAIPGVHSATVDRDFPHTLRISVRPERAVAVLRRDDEAWLVAASGRVLQPLEPGLLRPLPRVWIPSDTGRIEPGDVLLGEQGATAVRALASVPEAFPLEVESALGDDESLTLMLEGKVELRLGEPVDVREKLAAAAAVMDALGQTDARGLAYLDVSVPTRPVGAPKSQVETSA